MSQVTIASFAATASFDTPEAAAAALEPVAEADTAIALPAPPIALFEIGDLEMPELNDVDSEAGDEIKVD